MRVVIECWRVVLWYFQSWDHISAYFAKILPLNFHREGFYNISKVCPSTWVKGLPWKDGFLSNILYVIITIISKILHSSNFQTGVLMLFPKFGSHIYNFRQNISMPHLWIFNVGFCYLQSYVYKLKLLLLLNGPPSVTLELINSLFKDVRSLQIILYFYAQRY